MHSKGAAAPISIFNTIYHITPRTTTSTHRPINLLRVDSLVDISSRKGGQ